MESDGLYPGEIVPGQIQRIPGIGKDNGNKAGWYKFFADGIGGVYGDWSSGLSKVWQSKDIESCTPEQREAFQAEVAESRRQAEQDQKENYAKAEIDAKEIMENANEDTNKNSYFKKKGVYLGKSAKCGYWPQNDWNHTLLLPILSSDGTITSIQAINEDGDKRFLKGSRTKGCFFLLLEDGQTKPLDAIKKATSIVIGEGAASVGAVCEVMGYPGVAALSAGNLEPVAKEIRKLAPDANIIIVADNDYRDGTTENLGRDEARKAALSIGAKVAIPEPKDKPGAKDKKTDAWDVLHNQGLAGIKALIEKAAYVTSTCQQSAMEKESYRELIPSNLNAAGDQKIVGISLDDFLRLDFPPRSKLLSPWLPAQGLAMVYAYRGIGKTFFAISVAYAVASGGSYLGWKAPSPAGVLYIDGEMPGFVMQERLAAIKQGNDKKPSAPFIIVNPDSQPDGMMPRIDTEKGQAAIERILTNEIKLIVIDNISTLTTAKENEADGWTPVQGWALKQRAAGRSVLFIHHSGKGGLQRGTSRREDVLDTVIALRRPVDYRPSQGAVFEVHFEKNRGLIGDDVKPIEATLFTDDHDCMVWYARTVEDSTFDRVVSLLNEGLNQREVADELNINKSNVSRYAKKAKEKGLLFGDKEGTKNNGQP